MAWLELWIHQTLNMNKTYRCLTCGFALVVDSEDQRPLAEINLAHHAKELQTAENKAECPACHDYIRRGGRKNNKIKMPLIEQAGALVDEALVAEELARKNTIFQSIAEGVAVETEPGEKIFGFSVEDLQALKAEADAAKAQAEEVAE